MLYIFFFKKNPIPVCMFVQLQLTNRPEQKWKTRSACCCYESFSTSAAEPSHLFLTGKKKKKKNFPVWKPSSPHN